ncbi:hypothetical protein HYS99_01385 [Candidatus Giovannonibacteria bacterium]|nr:hypothetical protein [Candidatus Giovannonibacteria bacterium]
MNLIQIKTKKEMREPLSRTPSVDARALRNEMSTVLIELRSPHLNDFRLRWLCDE